MKANTLSRYPSAQNSPRPRRRSTAAPAHVAYESLECRSLFSAVAWSGAGDGVNWSDPANWSGHTMPGAGDDVTINVAGSPNIQLNGNDSVHSLNLSEPLTLSGGATLNVATTASSNQNVTLNGGTISGGAWTFSAGAGFSIGNATNSITGATISGDLFFSVANARASIEGGTTFATAHLSANSSSIAFAPGTTLTGSILCEGSGTQGRYVENNGASGTFTIGPTGVIKTAPGFAGFANIGSSFWFGGTMTLNNGGLVSAESGGKQLNLYAPTMNNSGTLRALNGDTINFYSQNWSSSGTISAVGSSLNFTNAWSNSGTLSIDNSTLTLGGTFTTAGLNLPGFVRNGGAVNLTGTLNNASSNLTLGQSTGTWNLSAGTINGGQLSYSNGQTLNFTSTGGTLKDVTVNGDLTLATDNAHVAVSGSSTFSAAHLVGNGSAIAFSPGYTLNSSILLEGPGTLGRYVEIAGSPGTLTVGPTGSIRTAPGFAGIGNIGATFWFGGSMTLNNNGLIRSDVSGRTLNITSPTFTNNGAIEAVNGSLNLSSLNWSNATAGTVAAVGSLVKFSGNWSNLGALSLTNSPLTLGGSFSTSSFNFAGFTRSGTGNVDLTGTLDNTGATLTLGAATGAWNCLGATINGGQIPSVGPQTLVLTSSGGTLNNVKVQGDITAAMSNAHVRLGGSTTFNTLHLIGDGSAVGFDFGYTLDSTILFEGAGTQGRYVETNGVGTFTIGPSGSIKTGAGFAGFANVGATFWFGGTMTLIDQGLISSDVSGRALNLKPAGGLTLSGTARSQNGGQLVIDSTGPVTISDVGSLTINQLHAGSLAIGGAATVVPGGGNNGLTVVTSLTFNGAGYLDLNDNDLMVTYTGTSPLPAIQSMIDQGRNGGMWNGNGPIRSTTAKNSSSHITTLGAMEASDYAIIHGGAFDNVSVPTKAVLVKYTYYGDANFSGSVNFDDYVRTDVGFNTNRTGWSNGDFNGDGSVNFDDYVLIDVAFNTQGGTLGRGGSGRSKF